MMSDLAGMFLAMTPTSPAANAEGNEDTCTLKDITNTMKGRIYKTGK